MPPFAKDLRIKHIGEAYYGNFRKSIFEIFVVHGQLRNVLAAEDSAVVSEKHNDRGHTLPKRADPDLPPPVTSGKTIGASFSAKDIAEIGFL
jgi:hypothetical protein